MKVYEHDVAVSAIRYDALLVADIVARLKSSLEIPVVWSGNADGPACTDSSSVLGADARVVIVVLHPLWAQEPSTAADSGMLRKRMLKSPSSVVLLVLDRATVPDWLEGAQRHELKSEGLDPLIQTVISAVDALGGSVTPASATVAAAAPSRALFGEHAPFLDQAKAHNTLRRELETLVDALEIRLDTESARDVDTITELSMLPNRYIARRGDSAISFSWLSGRLGGISDGELLVIHWDGVLPNQRGASALKTANRTREVVYRPEASDGDDWRWLQGGRSCSTKNLVAELFDEAALASQHQAR